MRGRRIFAFGSVLLVLLALVACGGATEKEAVDPNAELWSDIESRRSTIDDLKKQLAESKAQLEATVAPPEGEPAAEAAEGEPAEGEPAEGVAGPEQIESRIADLESDIASKTDELYGKIIEYINNSGLVEGAELSPEQRRAFDWKADIDISYAQEYIDKGGDYKKAIDIYAQALMSDETNAKLLEAKERAETLRYMDEERFGQVKKGMTQAEVKDLLGTVKNTNVRDFAEKDRLGWFYPKSPEAGGGAAGVYFRQKPKDSGNWVVEITDYEAVKGRAEGEEGEEEEEG